MKRWRFVLLFVLLFITVGFLAFSFQDLVQETIILPLSYLFWLGGLIYRSLDQRLYWVLLLGVIFILLGGSLNRNRASLKKDTPGEEGEAGNTRSSAWMQRIHLLSRGGYSREYSAIEFERLLVAVLAYQKHVSRKDALALLQSGEIEIPDSIREAFLNPAGSQKTGQAKFSPRNPLASFLDRLLGLGGRRRRNLNRAVDADLADLIRFMEAQLEIKDQHGHPPRS